MKEQEYESMWRDLKHWKWGVFYYNPQDDRILVPKKNPKMGATVNFGHKLWFLAFTPILIFLLVILPILYFLV